MRDEKPIYAPGNFGLDFYWSRKQYWFLDGRNVHQMDKAFAVRP
jgi:hypothetical protein